MSKRSVEGSHRPPPTRAIKFLGYNFDVVIPFFTSTPPINIKEFYSWININGNFRKGYGVFLSFRKGRKRY